MLLKKREEPGNEVGPGPIFKVLAGTEKSSGRNFRLEPELIH
jgi:hypothetical protein